MSKIMFKLLAFDLDKTILTDKCRVSEKDRKTLRKLHKSGIIIVISSGRMTECIRPFAKMIGLDVPIVGYNGAMVNDSNKSGNKVICHKPLEAKYSNQIIDYTIKHNYFLNFYYMDKLYAYAGLNLRKYSRLYSNQTGAKYHFITNAEWMKNKKPTKLLIVTEPGQRDKLYHEFYRRFNRNINVMKTNPEYLEFMNKHADKGTGIKSLAERYNVNRDEIICFGDNDNDVPMLEFAGTGVAVANANNKAKSAADIVLKATNNQNPITEFMKLYDVCFKN